MGGKSTRRYELMPQGQGYGDWWQINRMSIMWDNKIGPDYLWQRIPGPQIYIHTQALIIKTWKTIMVDKVLQYHWNHWVTLMLNMNNSYVQHKHWYHGTSNNNTKKRTYDVGFKLNTTHYYIILNRIPLQLLLTHYNHTFNHTYRPGTVTVTNIQKFSARNSLKCLEYQLEVQKYCFCGKW